MSYYLFAESKAHLHLHLSYKLSELQLLIWDVPFLQVDAGLTGFAVEFPAPTANGPTPTNRRRQVFQPIFIKVLIGEAFALVLSSRMMLICTLRMKRTTFIDRNKR